MKIINIAKTTLGESDSFKNSVESYFIDCLKEKSYYNDKRDYLTDTEIQLKQKFLKCLVDKKYITQKKYFSLKPDNQITVRPPIEIRTAVPKSG